MGIPIWSSPNHPGPAAAGPPEPSGEVLAAFPRQGPVGRTQELRVVLDTYRGRPYVSVRLWQRDPWTCSWWPLRSGISIPLSEAAGVAEALGRALDRVGT